jgi:hypothetical protein
MNKIYKVMYSKVKQCCVVVSEIAKSHGRHTKSSVAKSSAALTAAVLLALGAFSFVGMPSVQAESLYSNDYVGTNYKDDNGKSYSSKETKNYHGGGARGVGSNTLGMNAIAGKNTITIGDRDASPATESVYIGTKYDAENQVHPSSGHNVVSVGYGSDAAGTGSIAIGSGASADPWKNVSDMDKRNANRNNNSIAVGYNAQAQNNNIAIGANSVATATASTDTAKFRKTTDGDYNAPSSYISVGSDTDKRRITNVAAGSDDNDVATVGQLSYVEQEAKAKGSWKLTAGGTNESTVEAGSTVDFSAGTDGNLSVTKTADSNNVTIGLNKDVTLGKAAQGKGGSLSVYQDPSSAGQENGNDQLGSHVRIDGSTVSIRYQNGTKDSDARGVVLGVAKDSSNPLGYMYLADGNNSYYVHGTMTSDPQALQGRLVYNSSKTGYNYIANLEDGISFSGDAVKADSTKTNTTADTRLDPTAANHTLSIKGGVTDTTKLTSNNIGVVTTPTEYDGTLNNGVTKAGGLTIQLAKDLTDITSITSQTTGSTTGAKVTLDTKDNNIDVNQGKVTNLSDGTVNATSTDAVTGKQLYNLDNSSVKYDTTGTKVDKTKITLAGGATGTTITNVKAGTISANSTDAVNGAQLYAEQQARAQDKTKYYSVQEGPQIDGFSTNENNDGATDAALAGLAAGYETGTAGIGSTVVGSYSGVMNTGTASGVDLRGAASISLGTLNLNQNTDTSKTFSGVANSIIGQGNVTTNSNAAIILGAGNTITDSYKDVTIDTSKMKTDTPEELKDALQKAVPNSGAQVMAIGGGNKITSAYKTQVVGVGNTVSNTELNYVDGFNNTVTNGKSNYIIGAKNTLDSGNNNVIFGDNHKLSSKSNNVIIGSADDENKELTASNAVVIGHNADVSVDGGVAIGSGSVSTATAEADAEGYDPISTATNKASTNTSATWKATTGAVSIGGVNGNTTTTRRITNLAAGFNDTDAVNVAQIKKLASVDASNIGKNFKDGDVPTNENAWGEALGTGTVTKDNKQLVTGGTVYNEVRPSKDGKYVRMSQTTGDNLLALDDQVKTNTDKLSDVDSRSVKYDTKTENGKTVVDNAKITLAGDGGTTITNLKDGVNANDAATMGQLNARISDVTYKAGDGIKYDTDANNNKTISVNKGDGLKFDEGKLAVNTGKHLSVNTDGQIDVGDNGAVAEHDGNLVTGGTVYNEVRPSEDGEYVKTSQTTGANLLKLDNQVKTNTDKLSDVDSRSVKYDTKKVNDKTVVDNTKITLDGEGGTTITNLKDGVNANDAATVGQLDARISGVTYKAGDGIKYDTDADNNKTISVNKGDGLKFDEGKLAVDAGNGLKIDNGAVAIKTTDSNLKVDSNGIGLSDKITIGSDKTKQVTIDGTKGEISGLTNTTWDSKANDYSKSTKAATESQVDAAVKDAVKQAGENDIHVAVGSYAVNDQNQVSMNLVDKNNDTKGTVIITDVAKSSEMGDVSKLADGVKNAGGKTTTVVDAINNVNTSMNTKIGDQKYSTSNTSGSNKYVQDGDSITSAIGKLDGAVQQATTAAGQHSTVSAGSNITVTPAKQTDGHTDYQVALNKNITVDSVTAKTATTDTLTVNNSATIGGVTIANKTISGLDDTKIEKGSTNAVNAGTIWNELRPSGGTYINQNNTTAQNIMNLDTQVRATHDLINSDGKTIKIGGSDAATKIDVNGKDGKGRVITGVVSDAGDPTSAANVGYVNGVTAANTQQIYRDMNNAYGRLNNNINKAAAGSNALAALHPLDYDPDDKADFAVGYGHYRNANAAAVGAFYHPNENTMVNVGVSLGNGDPGFNAGVSFKVGRGGAGREAMSKTEMAKVINSQSKEIDALKKDNADKDKRIDALEQKMAEILAKLDKNGK